MKKFFYTLMVFAVLTVGLNSCDGDDPKPNGPDELGKAKIVLACDMSLEGSSVSYLVPATDDELFSGGSADASRAIEVDANAYVEEYNGWLFHLPIFNNTQITRYSRTEDGRLAKDASLALTNNAGDFLVNLLFLSPTKAYASLAGANKLVVFNPTEMTKIKEINLTDPSLSFDGEGTPNPFGMVYRDGKVFVGCTELADMPVCYPGAYMIVIDEATDTPEKFISDSRASSASYFDNCMFLDGNNDLYVLCWGSYGYAPGQAFGFLRIKNGETEFDKDYFLNIGEMNISGVEGGRLQYVNIAHYSGNGNVYAYGLCPALFVDPTDYAAKVVYPLQIDLKAQTVTPLPLPLTNSYSCAISHVGDEILFGLTTASNGSGVFSYNEKTGVASQSPILKAPGTVMSMKVFE